MYREIFLDAEEKVPELLARWGIFLCFPSLSRAPISISANFRMLTQFISRRRLPPRLDPAETGFIDYIEWSKLLQPQDLPRLVEGCVDKNGPLSKATPSPDEIDLIIRMHERVSGIAQCASENGVRLLIDAEQTYYQPAIDNLTISLMKTFNDKEKTDAPIIFNTYQCYLKDSYDRVDIDLNRASRNNYHFAAKLVRGAYMVAERERARLRGKVGAAPVSVCVVR